MQTVTGAGAYSHKARLVGEQLSQIACVCDRQYNRASTSTGRLHCLSHAHTNTICEDAQHAHSHVEWHGTLQKLNLAGGGHMGWAMCVSGCVSRAERDWASQLEAAGRTPDRGKGNATGGHVAITFAQSRTKRCANLRHKDTHI